MGNESCADLDPPRIEKLPAQTFAGSVAHYDSKAPLGIAEQWQAFGPHIPAFPGREGDAAYGVCYNFGSDGHFDYMCGVTVSDSPTLPAGMTSLQVAAATYAVFVHRDHITKIRDTMAAIWTKYLPESGLKPIHAPMLERYGPEFNPMTGMGGPEIWLPIEH